MQVPSSASPRQCAGSSARASGRRCVALAAPISSSRAAAAPQPIAPNNKGAPIRPCGRQQQHAGVVCQAVRADAATDGGLDTQAVQTIATITREAEEQLKQGVQANSAFSVTQPSSPLRERLLQSIRAVSKGLLERDVEVRRAGLDLQRGAVAEIVSGPHQAR